MPFTPLDRTLPLTIPCYNNLGHIRRCDPRFQPVAQPVTGAFLGLLTGS
ncbi:MAG: hypothetical protein K0B14_16480 [Anaerolineaceae bacterium]|nr:hypothetical protein [Anaerolineaceae bacterium]